MPGFIIYIDNNKIKKKNKLTKEQKNILEHYKVLLNNDNLNIDFFNEEQLEYIDDLYKLYDIDDILVLTLKQSKIKNIPSYLKELRYIIVSDCEELVNFPDTLPEIIDIDINNCNKIKYFPYYPTIEDLTIKNCYNIILPRKYILNPDIFIHFK